MDGWTTPAAAAVAAGAACVVLATLLVVVLLRARRDRRALLQETQNLKDELLARIEVLEQPEPAERASQDVVEFVITDVGQQVSAEVPAAPTRIEGRLFADVVLRETVVKAASWTYGLRTALSAENRNRVRFEMKRETKRSTKQRKSDVKEALREYYARQDAQKAEHGQGREAMTQEERA